MGSEESQAILLALLSRPSKLDRSPPPTSPESPSPQVSRLFRVTSEGVHLSLLPHSTTSPTPHTLTCLPTNRSTTQRPTLKIWSRSWVRTSADR